MNQVGNLVIIVFILIVLAAIVVSALMKRAKNDPESLRNPILDHINIDAADELYDIIEHFVDARDRVSRDARPKIPESGDYREELAAMEEKSRKAQEKMAKQDLEELELW